MPLEPLSQRYYNAVAIGKEGEDAALYLATVCSMLELSQLTKCSDVDKNLIAEAKRDQQMLARRGQQIRIA